MALSIPSPLIPTWAFDRRTFDRLRYEPVGADHEAFVRKLRAAGGKIFNTFVKYRCFLKIRKTALIHIKRITLSKERRCTSFF